MHTYHLKDLIFDMWHLFLFAMPLLFCALIVRANF